MDSKLTIYGDKVFDVVSSFQTPVHIKDATTGKYLISNQANLEVYNLSAIEEIIGLTVHDFDGFMKPYWGKEFSSHIHRVDHSVVIKSETVVTKDIVFVDVTGLLHIQNMTKIPVNSITGKKVSSIMTISEDFTDRVSNFSLYELYKRHYTTKANAIRYFMKHLKIEKFFSKTLTEKEMYCLLWMQKDQHYRSIADSLYVSIKTVEFHVTNIAAKLHNCSISDVLAYLRGS